MKITKINKNYIDEPENFNEMKKWFEERTNKHIDLVKKYCENIEDYDAERFKGLIEQSKDHDQSKFKDPEYIPYVYISWNYRCKDKGIKFNISKEIEEKMNEATNHHVTTNEHHPEKYSPKKVDLINRSDRDKPPEEIIDATKMPILSIAEMCADWFAMSEEKGSEPRGWADKNVNVRWKFTKDQNDIIYELIENIWEKC